MNHLQFLFNSFACVANIAAVGYFLTGQWTIGTNVGAALITGLCAYNALKKI